MAIINILHVNAFKAVVLHNVNAYITCNDNVCARCESDYNLSLTIVPTINTQHDPLQEVSLSGSREMDIDRPADTIWRTIKLTEFPPEEFRGLIDVAFLRLVLWEIAFDRHPLYLFLKEVHFVEKQDHACFNKVFGIDDLIKEHQCLSHLILLC